MNITNYVLQGRDDALLYGDYSTYRRQLTKRLLSSRKKLGIATKNRGKFQKRDDVAPQEVLTNQEHVHLLLLTSERAWAHALSIKAAHSAAQKDISGRVRSHIVSRLNKAARTAELLADALSVPASGGISTSDMLEAKSYAALIRGAMLFEKQSWELCLQSYAVSRIIYSAIANAEKNGDLFKDVLSDTIDPSIRYAAYQLKTPRTVPIPSIAKRAFPRSDAALVREIDRLDPSLLSEGDEAAKSGDVADNAPRTIAWRSREVQIEDAQISLAWASVDSAKTRLSSDLAGARGRLPHQIASQYDEILMATQDAVDAAKHAIDELKAEGVSQGDERMQRLQMTRTAVNFEMISWRIGRNRVLTGPDDGGPEEYSALRRRKARATKETDGKGDNKKARQLPASKKLAKLKEKVALYDGTLQNLDSIKQLPGVAADRELAARLDGYVKYFGALKCLSIARSHAIDGSTVNSLALINHANSLVLEASSKLPQADGGSDARRQPLSIDVHPDAMSCLGKLINGELQRFRAIVHMHNLRKAEQEKAVGATEPLVTQLHEYPTRVDLDNLVQFPPRMNLIPVKPIFLDVAWNYINYPGREPTQAAAAAPAAASAQPQSVEEEQPKKKGWFGFGR